MFQFRFQVFPSDFCRRSFGQCTQLHFWGFGHPTSLNVHLDVAGRAEAGPVCSEALQDMSPRKGREFTKGTLTGWTKARITGAWLYNGFGH